MMKRFFLVIVLIFPGCAAQSAVLTPTPVVDHPLPARTFKPVSQPAAPAEPPAPPDLTVTIEDVAMQYHAIELRMVGVVTSENVTPGYIRNVQLADQAARSKLAVLEAERGRPSRRAIEEARIAVAILGEVLAEPPDKTESP